MYQNNSYRRPVQRPVRSQKSRRKPLVFIVVLLIVTVIGLGGWLLVSKRQSESTANTPAAPTFDKTQFSLDDPASPWIVVNKKRPLGPREYSPAQLVAPSIDLEGAKADASMQLHPEAAAALERLDAAARQAGVQLIVLSAFRSYATQSVVYASEVRGFGQEQADRESARPGHSEHQTGWAVDLGASSGECRIKACFGDTPEGRWLGAHAHEHGFIIRYQAGQEAVTGYNPEPWHLRYVGPLLAAELHQTGTKTLEAFFNLPAAPDY